MKRNTSVKALGRVGRKPGIGDACLSKIRFVHCFEPGSLRAYSNVDCFVLSFSSCPMARGDWPDDHRGVAG